MVEVFEKAATQHHFINMYADLCVLLKSHFAKHHLADDANVDFEKLLLVSLDVFSETFLGLPSDLELLDEEDRLVLECKHKTRRVGSTKFLGALITREMVNSKILFDTCQEHLTERSAESLELLAALLTTVGPTLDTTKWHSYSKLESVFQKVHQLTSDRTVNRRVCFLFKDLLELRASGWMLKSKFAAAPSTLKEVAEAQAAEANVASSQSSRPKQGVAKDALTSALRQCSRSLACREQAAEPDACYFGRSCNWAGCKYSHPNGRLMDEQQEATPKAKVQAREPAQPCKHSEMLSKVGKVKRRYRKNVCRKEVTEALAELLVSCDIALALVRIAAIAVPASKQPEEFCDMLKQMIKEDSELGRKVFFQMVVSLFTEGVWTQAALTTGLESLLEEIRDELENQPALSKVLWEELHPAIAPLVSKAISH